VLEATTTKMPARIEIPKVYSRPADPDALSILTLILENHKRVDEMLLQMLDDIDFDCPD
jgi:hypothetical protein